MPDDKKPIIHASEMERIFLCPGSVSASEGLPELKLYDEIAASGQRVHDALKRFYGLGITDLDDLAVLCNLAEDEKIKAKWFINHVENLKNKHGGAVRVWAELYLAATDDQIEGTTDLLLRCVDNTYHVVDYKTGWGSQVDSASNLQLRTYIIKIADKFGMPQIAGHLFQWGNNPDEGVLYGPEEINAFRREIYAIRDAAFEPHATRHPHPKACQFCRANGNPKRCPESCAPMLPAVIEQPMTPELAAKLKNIYLTLKTATQARERFETWLRGIIATQPDTVPWAKLSTPRQRRTIADANKTFELGIKYGWFDQAEFVSEAITVKLPAVEKLAKKHHGKKIDKKAVEDTLKQAGVLEIKDDKPSIEIQE